MAHWKTRLMLIIALLSSSLLSYTQESISKTFYDSRVVNGHSVEMSNEGELKMIIAHRFGNINGGAYELFGLDHSSIRLGLDYGISNMINIGIGRSSFEKTVDGFVKFKLIKQNDKSPVNVVWLSSIAANGLHFQDTSRENYFSSRLFYTHQLLIARKINDRISMQIMPSVVHKNLQLKDDPTGDIYSIGIAARYMITKRLTANIEYYGALPNQLNPIYNNSLAIGFNIETKGHVFQIHFGNSRGMIEKFFIAENPGSWAKGDIGFGFNITRDFKLKGR